MLVVNECVGDPFMALTAAATDATPPSLSAANALLPISATISKAVMMMMTMVMKIVMTMVMTMMMTSAAGTERQALPIPSTPAA